LSASNCKLFDNRYDVAEITLPGQLLNLEYLMSHFAVRLHEAISKKGTPALVGLDPRFDQLPAEIVAEAKQKYSNRAAMVANAYETFCCRVIDIVAPLVPAVKPQAAFFEEWTRRDVCVVQCDCVCATDRVDCHLRC